MHWILWAMMLTHPVPQWSRISVYPSQPQCEKALKTLTAGALGSGSMQAKCLPDDRNPER